MRLVSGRRPIEMRKKVRALRNGSHSQMESKTSCYVLPICSSAHIGGNELTPIEVIEWFEQDKCDFVAISC